MALPPGSHWLPRVSPETGERQAPAESDPLVHLDSLHALALKLTRDRAAAEDLVQDTYVKVVRFWPSFRRGSNLKAWLFTILRNTFRNDRRSAGRQPVDVDTDVLDRLPLPSLDDDPEHRLIRATMDADLHAALQALPEAYRETVWLRDVEDCSYQQIAGILDVPVGTVMSRLSRGRRLLHATLVAFRARAGAGAPAGGTEAPRARLSSTPGEGPS